MCKKRFYLWVNFQSILLWLFFQFSATISFAQFGEFFKTNLPAENAVHDISPRDNMSVLSLLKEIDTDGFHENAGFRFAYEYQQADFTDKTNWVRLLDFRPPHSPKVKQNGEEWNQITEVVFTLKGDRGIVAPSEIIDTKKEVFSLYENSRNSTLRRLEIILKNINITLPLVPEPPPEYMVGIGLMGVADLRTYDVGQIDIKTKEGDFSIRLSFPLKIQSAGSKLQYPFYDYAFADFIDDMLFFELRKRLARDVFDHWSGNTAKKTKLRDINSVIHEHDTSTAALVQQVTDEAKTKGEPAKSEENEP